MGLLRRGAEAADHRRERRHRHDLDRVRHGEPDAGRAADGPAGARRDPGERAAEAAGPHLHRAGRGEGRQGRPGAGSAHQGHPAPLRLGLQHDPPARRRAAGRLRHADADPHPARQAEEHRQAAVGARAAARAVLRRDGGRAAAGLGHDLDAAAAPQRRQSRQQGAGRRARRSICRSMSTARCSRSATAMARRATARSASRRSRPG